MLHHFTAPDSGHLDAILRDGVIALTESNVSLSKPRAGPDVVWLTDDPNPDAHVTAWAGGPKSGKVKTMCRFTVELERGQVMRWTSFCTRYRVRARAIDGLAANDPRRGASWWVALEPVDRATWRELVIDIPGETLRRYEADELATLRAAPAWVPDLPTIAERIGLPTVTVPDDVKDDLESLTTKSAPSVLRRMRRLEPDTPDDG